ncbi:MAG: hypothetical protein CVU56_15340 [Deltaproteobacteria bacterium HGW-Deltaproteobacteria-14]|nr:MAG: hypothetical protein CVU56_15340 [Deltaproteobacteria bacterium HGW-Deltaproteobacteria-14]
MSRSAALAAVALLALAPGCAITPIEDARQELLLSWGAWLLDRYDATAAAADALETQVEALCAAPDAAGLAAARDAWDAARRPWKEAEVFAFGPYSEEPIRLGPKVDFWPARPDSVRAVLADTAPIDASQLGAPAKGFAAIELVLWDPDGAPLAALAAEPRRCAYLAAVVPDLAARVRELRAVWDPAGQDFLGELTAAGERDTQYASLQLAFGEVVNRVGYLLENIRAEKLGKPLGVTAGSAQPERVESPFSGRGLGDIRDNLVGARRLLLGDGAGDLGLDGYLRGRGRHLAPLLTARFDAALAALDALDAPLTAAIEADPASVEALFDRVGELQRAVQVDVLGALSVTVGFNDADGD